MGPYPSSASSSCIPARKGAPPFGSFVPSRPFFLNEQLSPGRIPCKSRSLRLVVAFALWEGRKDMSRSRLATAILLTGLLCALEGCMGLPHPPCAPAPEPGCWGGIYPLVMTPFCENGVDILSLERQIRHELSGGVQGLLVLGTFGEGQYVTPAERVQVISTAVRVAAGSVPVVAGIHSGDLADARAQ